MLKDALHWINSRFQTPSAEALALDELEMAKRELLEAQSAREYADSMCKYHDARIKRLTIYLHTVMTETA
jgi:hypothetical protein